MADEKTFTQADIDAAVEAAKNPLDTKNRELLNELKEARKSATITPEQLAAVEQERDDLRGKLSAAEKDLKAAKANEEKAVKALEAESGFTERLLKQNGLKDALIANGVKDEDFLKSLTAQFASETSILVDGAERKAMLGDKPLADAIKEWAGSDAGKKFVAAPGNGGGGAPGGSGGAGGGANPFAKETWNMTAQAHLLKSDPAGAAALAKSAGVELAA